MRVPSINDSLQRVIPYCTRESLCIERKWKTDKEYSFFVLNLIQVYSFCMVPGTWYCTCIVKKDNGILLLCSDKFTSTKAYVEKLLSYNCALLQEQQIQGIVQQNDTDSTSTSISRQAVQLPVVKYDHVLQNSLPKVVPGAGTCKQHIARILRSKYVYPSCGALVCMNTR